MPLSKPLAEVFALFRRGRRFTAAQIAHTLREDPGLSGPEELHTTAINNRLEQLRKFGFLDRAKEGRAQRYFKKETPG
jgi:hypothetical protein